MPPSELIVSVVLPCLNEEATVGTCVRKALASLRTLPHSGEVVVADNGSTDGSVRMAIEAGARVVHCPVRGYGAAIRCGIENARGDVIVMADADDSYDLLNLGPFIEPLVEGQADMVMGNRFRGGIAPGAMPWKNRYIGNPLLSGFLRLLFRGSVQDVHCGLRGFTRKAFERMAPSQPGMEFASELVVRGLQIGLRIVEVPTRLFPDGRVHPPHLRPYRDGMRHLTYLVRERLKTGSLPSTKLNWR
jgi:glycosyltransferase involved in cell wall biosynthesis